MLTTHRLSAALAAEAVGEAVTACAKQGYKVTAAILDTDGVTQPLLRGDGASMTTLGAARDKAYTVLMLGGSRNENTSGAIVQRANADRGYCFAADFYSDRALQQKNTARRVAISTRLAPKPVSIRSADG